LRRVVSAISARRAPPDSSLAEDGLRCGSPGAAGEFFEKLAHGGIRYDIRSKRNATSQSQESRRAGGAPGTFGGPACSAARRFAAPAECSTHVALDLLASCC